MSRIELTEQFFEDEVREGFYIPACIKQAWGAQIQVLNAIDRVCFDLGIKYFADWGTFLGAVRHGGFIPWDDDFDICMLRDDYNRFMAEGVSKLPDGYAVFNLEMKGDHDQFVANIVNRTRICFEHEHLTRFHGFPYISAVDVFLLDYVSPDERRQEEMKAKAQYILRISDEIREGKLKGKELKSQLADMERLLGIRIPSGFTEQKIRQVLDIEAEKLFSSFVMEKNLAHQIVQMMPWGLNDTKYIPRYYYSDTVDLPFETGSVPVPIIYEDALRIHYGDYMQLYKNAGGHDYPFFARSRAQLQEVLDFELPEYKVDPDELIKKAKERSCGGLCLQNNTYTAVVSECVTEMKRLTMVLMESEESAAITDISSRLQQLAIDLGTYMETVKGEGYDIVAMLENYCEVLYELTQAVILVERKELLDRVDRLLNEISEMIRSRKEVLFLPFKGEYWTAFEEEYKKAMGDPNIDVYVVPIPYYYKDYMGRMHDMQYYPERYPDTLELTHYDAYDYAVHHPDVIMIQNPYDNYNDEMSVPPFFYSDKLLQITDMLVYVPWFETDDFTKRNEREYINMRYYCTMPGVINADMVLLKSEILRNTYIEKLCDFVGETTRELWEKKLIVRNYGDDPEIFGTDKDDKNGKVLLYYVDLSEILQRGQSAVDKMEAVISEFADNSDSLNYLFLKNRNIDDKLMQYNMGLYESYMKLLKQFGNTLGEHGRIIDEKESDYDSLVKECCAYYGDGGRLAHMFRNAGKPVMIQNYDIECCR